MDPSQTLVPATDWTAESAITDTGFDEAAADAMFASLAALNSQSDGALFNTNLHFIGEDRGVSANSEIIQRLGAYFPATNFPNQKIYETSLDPTEASQTSLNIPLASLLKTAVNVLYIANTSPPPPAS